MDGGLCDSIPVKHALADGNNRAVVVLTRPQGYRKKPLRHSWIFRLFYRKYPRLVECIQRRNHEYNRTLDHIEQLERAGTIFVIRPQSGHLVSRLENNPDRLQYFYEQAYLQMNGELDRLKEWLRGGVRQ